ncbi:MAG: hypothetical protein ACFE8A_01630 [Candidatus Hodarchaeota archaeon]
MRGSRTLKKIAPFLVVVGIFTAMAAPLALHTINELTPYLNLSDVVEMPEATMLDSFEIVDKEYDKTAEERLFSVSNTEIKTTHPIYEVDGIFLQSEYDTMKYPRNYFTEGKVYIHDNVIDVGYNPLPNYTYSNVHTRSTFLTREVFNISQSADDAYIQFGPPIYPSGATLDLGGAKFLIGGYQICLRWNLSIPENSNIIYTYLDLTLKSANLNGFISEFFTFDSINTSDFSDTNENIYQTRPLIEPGVIWDLYNKPVIANVTWKSPDISSLMNLIIGRDDWKNNSIFGLFLEAGDLYVADPDSDGVEDGEFVSFHSFDGPNPLYKPKLNVGWEKKADPYTYKKLEISKTWQHIDTGHNILNVIGVWNTSDHSYGNLYNESNGDYFDGKHIYLKTPQPRNQTSLWYSIKSDEAPVVVEYTIKEWTSITWRFNLKLDNRGDNDVIFPAANVTLNYLDERLGEGWIPHTYEVPAHQDEIFEMYIIMENDKQTSLFVNALLLGLPIELIGIMEIYILIEDANGDPLLPIKQSQEFEFFVPAAERGPPPFIHSLNRGGVSAYEDVEITITATDEGTGINDHGRSFIYYSVDNGISWEQAQLTGPPWDWKFKGEYLGSGTYPLNSTLSPQTYSGEIPGFQGGTHVLFYIYLEDYADNYEHKKPGNIAISQTYSYVVPSGGALPSFSVEFVEIIEDDAGDKFFDYIEEHGININYYLYSKGTWFTANWVFKYLPYITTFAEILYDKDVDHNYANDLIVIDLPTAIGILADSGVASGYLLQGLGINLEDFFTYLVDHIMLPVNDEYSYIAQQRRKEIFIVDNLEGSFVGDWSSIPSDVVNEYDDSKFTKIQLNDTYTIKYSEDDAYTRNTGTIYNGLTLALGGYKNLDSAYQRRICLRYNLTIPKNAVILNAYLNLTVESWSTVGGSAYNGFTSQIWTFDNVSTPDFSNSGENIMNTRSRVSGPIDWPMPDYITITKNQSYLSPDIASLLQNIVNRDNWQSASENSTFGIYIDASTGLNERLYFHSFDGPNPDYTPKLIVNWAEPLTPTYKQSDFDATDQLITTDYNIINVIGVWNTSDHSYGNLYNESNGDYFTGNYTILKTPQPLNQTALWIRYESDEILVESDNELNINGESIGTRSLKWARSEPSILIRDESLNYIIDIEDYYNIIDIEEEEILTFYIDYNNYTRLNGKISFNFVDNLGRKMRSNPIQFGNTSYGDWQEIALPINYQNFRIDTGFDFKAEKLIEFEYSGTEQVEIYIDHISIYSKDAYSSHQYFTYNLQIRYSDFSYFLANVFLKPALKEKIIPNTGDPNLKWNQDRSHTSYWNFLDLIATSKVFVNEWDDEEFNQHSTGANLLLEWYGVQNQFEAFCSLIGAEIEELEPATTEEDIYPYAQKFAMTAIYFSLGFIASLASIKRIGRYRSRKKIEKIRKKYGKKIIK